MNNESFYMHPRYNEFLVFLKTLESDARITPNSLNLAFDVWLSNQLNVELINENTILRAKADVFLKSCKAYEESNETLKADLDRLHRDRDSFQQQARVLAEEVERLNGLFLQWVNVAMRVWRLMEVICEWTQRLRAVLPDLCACDCR
jgi:hypothetical protein